MNISLPFNFTLMSWLAGSKGAEGGGFSILLFRILGGGCSFFGRDEGQYSSWKWALNHFTHTPVQSSANLEFSFYWFLYQSRNFRVSLIPPLKKKQWVELTYLINYSTYTVYLCTYIHLYCYVTKPTVYCYQQYSTLYQLKSYQVSLVNWQLNRWLQTKHLTYTCKPILLSSRISLYGMCIESFVYCAPMCITI